MIDFHLDIQYFHLDAVCLTIKIFKIFAGSLQYARFMSRITATNVKSEKLELWWDLIANYSIECIFFATADHKLIEIRYTGKNEPHTYYVVCYTIYHVLYKLTNNRNLVNFGMR